MGCIFTTVEQTLFKCPSVPSFKKDDAAASCNQEGVSYACFSLREGVTWQCLTGDASVPNCIATQIPLNEQAEKGETYDGVCVHEGSSSWESAEDGDKLSIRTTSTTITTESTTTTSTTTESTTTESTTITSTSTTTEPTSQTTSKQTTETPSTSQTPASTTTTTTSGTVKSQVGFAAFAVLAVMLNALLM